MKLFLALVICLQLFTSWAMPLNTYVAVACNGQEALAMAELAVDHINIDRKHGYKLSLDRIENAQDMSGANGTTLHFLDIDVRETKCHVLSRKPLKDCEIRSFRDVKVDGDCKMVVETKVGAPGHVAGYKCEISPDSADDVAEKCLDCPHLILANSTGAQHAAQVSLEEFNKKSNHMHTFKLEEITRATTKGLGTPVLVEYVIRETPCRKGSLACPLILLTNPDRGFCASTVTPLNSTGETIDIACELYSTKVAEAPGPAVEGEGGAAPTVHAESDATLAPEVPVDATPVVKTEDSTVAAPEDGSHAQGTEDHDAPSTAPDAVSVSPEVEISETIPPKRKRAAEESSESSEELIFNTGKQVLHFPDLPADPITCPTMHKYPKYQ
ncbi:alpha-2-HS-glycoprotein-like [Scyliorhinus canicula]|uniref:alpha-2-HS-glycoprotein-like n=1 Tax=Scyliorhinus canicula TaxID=7830 RepID=UPI0018F406D6|nr:alpha-2-HS-glycoprotein-like [Scyliorhinus canicula]